MTGESPRDRRDDARLIRAQYRDDGTSLGCVNVVYHDLSLA